MLRDGGRLSDACARFAEAKQAAAGVDVSLDLADCFERQGRTTSAWAEFSAAEKLARQRNDPRADQAHARMQALQPRLKRLTIAVGGGTAGDGSEILLDGQVVPRDSYNAPLSVDPGDHVLTVVPKLGPRRTLAVKVDRDTPPTTVNAEDARAAAPPPAPAAPAIVSATPASAADALFEDGKRLIGSGQITEACSKFEQSQALAAGVGVTLRLGDCYERLGRTASAWTEYKLAENAAHAQSDKRESTAHARAAELEPRLERVTIEVPASTSPDGCLVQLDGRTVPASMWNVAMAADPGDHVVTFEAAGAQRRTLPVHLDATTPSAIVKVVEPAAVASAAPASPAPPPPPADEGEGEEESQLPKWPTRTWVEIGLLGGAVVAAGVGGALLVSKNDSMSNTGANGRPYVDPVAAAASKVAFAVAGAAAASAIVVYLTTPHPKDSGLRLSPAPVVGGGAALLSGSF